MVLTWGLRYFWKRKNIKKWVCSNRGLRHLCTLCIEASKKFHAEPVCFFIVFWYLRFLKALFYFIAWLLNSSNLHSYGSSLRKTYTWRLLLPMHLGRSTPSILGLTLPFPLSSPPMIFLQGKNHIKNLDNFRQAGKSKKLRFDELLLSKK